MVAVIKKKPGKNKCWRERGKIGTLINYRWEWKTLENSLAGPQKVKHRIII